MEISLLRSASGGLYEGSRELKVSCTEVVIAAWESKRVPSKSKIMSLGVGVGILYNWSICCVVV